jgi:hypothetical protein
MTLQELETTIRHLPSEQLLQFREWFLEFDAKNWDQQIESDACAGRLDALADAALREHRNGKSTRL